MVRPRPSPRGGEPHRRRGRRLAPRHPATAAGHVAPRREPHRHAVAGGPCRGAPCPRDGSALRRAPSPGGRRSGAPRTSGEPGTITGPCHLPRPSSGSTGSTTLVLVVLLVALGVVMVVAAIWLVQATRSDSRGPRPARGHGQPRVHPAGDAEAREAALASARPEGAIGPAPMIDIEDENGDGARRDVTGWRYCRPHGLARHRPDARPVPGSRAGRQAATFPPVAGEERQAFVSQAQLDFQDFAIIGDAEARSRTASSPARHVGLVAASSTRWPAAAPSASSWASRRWAVHAGVISSG